MTANAHVPLPDVSDLLSISVRVQGTTTTIELSGEWDLTGATAVRRTVARVLDGAPECVVLDLSQLAFMDSSGLHVTVELARRAALRDIRLVIIDGPRQVRRLFETSGLVARLPVVEPVSRSGEARAAP